jgi:predicted MFS family arabinose efflux permease
MPDNARWRLSLMMFLEYVIWGSWLPLLALYLSRFLGFSGTEIGWIFATQAVASVTAVFVSGQIADRYFSTERFLAASHVVGGLAMLTLAFQKSFWPFFATMLVYSLAYVPTLSLTNSICFHHLKDAQKEFGRVRLWGTIGWIAASWPFVLILKGKEGAALGSALTSIFVVAGLASLALAAVSLMLPATPPARSAGEKYAPLESIKLLRNPTVLVLFVATFLDALVHQCYFQWTSPFLSAIGIPENMIMPAMSIGQIAEIATMAGLGYFLARLGWRWTMIFGSSATSSGSSSTPWEGPRGWWWAATWSTASATRSSSPRSTSSWTSTSRATRGPARRASSTSSSSAWGRSWAACSGAAWATSTARRRASTSRSCSWCRRPWACWPRSSCSWASARSPRACGGRAPPER